MSLILDALKKSETDRQKQSGPGIADVPVATPGSGAPKWLPIGIGLLGVNLIVLLFVLLRPAPAPSTGNSEAVDPVPGNEVASVDPRSAGSAPAPSMPRETTGDPEVQPRSRVPDSVPAQVEPAVSAAAIAQEPAAQSSPVSAPPADTGSESASIAESYLTFNDLRAQGLLDLPDLHVDLHVYSGNPAERFVFINMDKHVENDVLGAGPRLREITPEGVILDYRGTTFLLPRE